MINTITSAAQFAPGADFNSLHAVSSESGSGSLVDIWLGRYSQISVHYVDVIHALSLTYFLIVAGPKFYQEFSLSLQFNQVEVLAVGDMVKRDDLSYGAEGTTASA